jgi:hypothetical protein
MMSRVRCLVPVDKGPVVQADPINDECVAALVMANRLAEPRRRQVIRMRSVGINAARTLSRSSERSTSVGVSTK